MAARLRVWTLVGWLVLGGASARAQQDVDFDGTRPAAGAAADGSTLWDKFKKLVRRTPPPPPPPSAPVAAPAAAPNVKIVSWNLQTFGERIQEARRRASARVMGSLSADSSIELLAAQEIANDASAAVVESELDSHGHWTRSFEDTSDPQDNGFFARDGAVIECSGLLFADRERSRHPARAAHVRIGALDFTIVTLHLAYDHGRASHAFDELRAVLDWVRAYEARPGADPDVVIAGDFNLPTAAGKALSQRANVSEWQPIDDVLAEYADLGLTALVDEPTSRRNGAADNNYDHFVISRHLAGTAYVSGSARRMPVGAISAAEASEGTQVSDHFPISAELRQGGVGNDGRPIRLDGARACPL